jgi:hypothetical protein
LTVSVTNCLNRFSTPRKTRGSGCNIPTSQIHTDNFWSLTRWLGCVPLLVFLSNRQYLIASISKPLKRYKERQRAEGRRKEVLIKTLVVGLKPISIKRFVSRCVARETRRPYFNPTFKNVGSISAFCLLPPAFCLLK